MKFWKIRETATTKTLILFNCIRINLKKIYHKKTYSQDGEDVVLEAFYAEKFNYKGFYVDIGALHPLRCSNTQIFYEKGWRGINIDATPGSMKEFEKIRPEDINVEAAISNVEQKLFYYLMHEPGLNNFSAERTEYLASFGYHLKEKIELETSTINSILEKYLPVNQKIDFINVDIEGHDVEVVKSLDFEKYAPDYFLIEELDYINPDFVQYGKSEMHQFLSGKGYKVVAKTMRTVIYSKSEIQI